jgi:integrator complex subunit 11
MGIEIYPLGAGQEIGRSCIILNILDRTIMLDCGLHMTHHDQRRFPDFSVYSLIAFKKKIPPNDSGLNQVNLVLITHFHLDHCGALPYFSEINRNHI